MRRWRWLIVVVAMGVSVCDTQEKLKFEVASVREVKDATGSYSNFPLNMGPQYNAEGGLLTARNMPLMQFLVFAYTKNMFQIQAMRSQLPEWARSTRYDIQARAEGSPTKDDMRAMMRTLLQERFGVKVHTEMREVPVFWLTLVKPGKMGDRMKVHGEGEAACAKEPPLYIRNAGQENVPTPAVAGGYPAYCGAVVNMPGAHGGMMRVGGRAVSMAEIAVAVGGVGQVERPVVDRTGLAGTGKTFDMTLEFTPESVEMAREGEGVDVGPVLTTALREQLGMKLESGKGMVEVVVLDKVEKPGEN